MKGGQQSPQPEDPHPDPISFEATLRRYFVKRVGTADADDLVQEVLVRLQARKSQDSINDMASYVFAVASNVLKEARRKSGAFVMPRVRPMPGFRLPREGSVAPFVAV